MLVIFIISLILFLLSFSLKIEVSENLISSFNQFKNIGYKVSLNLFNKFKVFSIKIHPNKWNKNMKLKPSKILKILKFIKNHKIIKIEKFISDLEISMENPIFTSYTVAILSSIIAIFLARTTNTLEKSKYHYKIFPLYINKNKFNLSINCIVSIKLVHIIYMIYVLRKDDVKNGRTSNRRSYDNCYE